MEITKVLEILAEEKETAIYQIAICQNDYNPNVGVYFKGKLKIIRLLEEKIKKSLYDI
jgi:hypothetical protein